MARSPELVAEFVSLTLRAHAPCAETRGLAHADREDVVQDALVVLLRRTRVAGDAAVAEALPKLLGGVLCNVGRNEKRRRVREGCGCGREKI